MLLSLGNKSGDSFNFYLQKSIAQWEPNLNACGEKLFKSPKFKSFGSAFWKKGFNIV